MWGRWLLSLVAVAGHFAVWVTVFNRMNAWPRRWSRALEQSVFLLLSAPLLWLAWHVVQGRMSELVAEPPRLAVAYAAVCFVALAAKAPEFVRQQWRGRAPAALLRQEVVRIDVAAEIGRAPAGGSGPFWRLLPGNESWHLAVERKCLWTPELPASLSGLTITHLSDLHFTGRLGMEYFERVVAEANGLESDLIVLTGDLVDERRCLDWVEPLLGRLRAPLGVHYILGNHDARPGEQQVRGAVDAAGLTPLGGRATLLEVEGRQVLLAGDERPWFGDAPDLAEWDRADFRVLLAHTPDQYPWARSRGFDLMLAGHTHGGQVRLPLLGPTVSPSLFGTRYASGVFDEPPTVMHVSRGISGQQPIRWRCPPELTQLTLQSVAQIQASEPSAVGRQEASSRA